MNTSVTKVVAQNADYFIADLNNGGVRLGMFDVCAFDFPAGHSDFEKVKGLNLSDAEEVFDDYYARYTPAQTDGYRNA